MSERETIDQNGLLLCRTQINLATPLPALAAISGCSLRPSGCKLCVWLSASQVEFNKRSCKVNCVRPLGERSGCFRLH